MIRGGAMDGGALAIAIAIGERQYGYITWKQARDAGLTKPMIDRLVRDGYWQRLGGGLYRMNGVASTWRSRMMGACLRGGDGAVVSHRSAAAVWGLEGFGPPMTIDLTVP